MQKQLFRPLPLSGAQARKKEALAPPFFVQSLANPLQTTLYVACSNLHLFLQGVYRELDQLLELTGILAIAGIDPDAV